VCTIANRITKSQSWKLSMGINGNTWELTGINWLASQTTRFHANPADFLGVSQGSFIYSTFMLFCCSVKELIKVMLTNKSLIKINLL